MAPNIELHGEDTKMITDELGDAIEQVRPNLTHAMLRGAVDGDVKQKGVASLTLGLLLRDQAGMDRLLQ